MVSNSRLTKLLGKYKYLHTQKKNTHKNCIKTNRQTQSAHQNYLIPNKNGGNFLIDLNGQYISDTSHIHTFGYCFGWLIRCLPMLLIYILLIG